MTKIDVRRVLDLIGASRSTGEAGGITPLLQAHIDHVAVAGAAGSTHESWTKCAAH